VRTVVVFTDGHGRAAPAACSGLTCAAEPGVYRLCPSRPPDSSNQVTVRPPRRQPHRAAMPGNCHAVPNRRPSHQRTAAPPPDG
jgi:hypothetical protein